MCVCVWWEGGGDGGGGGLYSSYSNSNTHFPVFPLPFGSFSKFLVFSLRGDFIGPTPQFSQYSGDPVLARACVTFL